MSGRVLCTAPIHLPCFCKNSLLVSQRCAESLSSTPLAFSPSGFPLLHFWWPTSLFGGRSPTKTTIPDSGHRWPSLFIYHLYHIYWQFHPSLVSHLLLKSRWLPHSSSRTHRFMACPSITTIPTRGLEGWEQLQAIMLQIPTFLIWSSVFFMNKCFSVYCYVFDWFLELNFLLCQWK